MAEDQDSSQKTEEPTQRRIEEARKNGQVAYSREVTSFMMILGLTLLFVWIMPRLASNTILSFHGFLSHPHDMAVDAGTVMTLYKEIIRQFFVLMAFPFILLVVFILGSAMMQNGFLISSESLVPKLEKISPLRGIKRLFSAKSFVEFLKGLFKITVIGIVGVMVLLPYMHKIIDSFSYTLDSTLSLLSLLGFYVLLGACIVMAILAVIDYLYQRYEYMKSLRMSKQDLKEEFKQSEGNPEVKAKLRQIRLERVRKRMMAQVPEADVVITNPEHFAVALKYDVDAMNAPLCIAKGQDYMAQRIKEVAKQHDIPIIENKPLARALFASTEVDQEIPVEHYKAVAEVISYVYKLKGKRLARQ